MCLCFLWDIGGSAAVWLVTHWPQLHWLHWCLPGSLEKEPALSPHSGAVAVLCFSLCQTGEHGVGQRASQLATASLCLLHPGASSLQCIWICWKAEVGRVPKINRNILFLLPLLYPQRLFRCCLKQRSSRAHCLSLPALCLLQVDSLTISQCKGIPAVSLPENGVYEC